MGSIGRGMVASATVVMMAEEEIDVLVEIERGNGSLTLVFCVRVSLLGDSGDSGNDCRCLKAQFRDYFEIGHVTSKRYN
jgi:hypothetical protein